MTYNVITDSLSLPATPKDWVWKVWKDRVDGLPKVFIRLSDELGHCVKFATLDVKLFGDKAEDIIEHAGTMILGALREGA